MLKQILWHFCTQHVSTHSCERAISAHKQLVEVPPARDGKKCGETRGSVRGRMEDMGETEAHDT